MTIRQTCSRLLVFVAVMSAFNAPARALTRSSAAGSERVIAAFLHELDNELTVKARMAQVADIDRIRTALTVTGGVGRQAALMGKDELAMTAQRQMVLGPGLRRRPAVRHQSAERDTGHRDRCAPVRSAAVRGRRPSTHVRELYRPRGRRMARAVGPKGDEMVRMLAKLANQKVGGEQRFSVEPAVSDKPCRSLADK